MAARQSVEPSRIPDGGLAPVEQADPWPAWPER
jgi:hypothetical protein